MTILLVDDHPLMRDGVRRLVTSEFPGAEIAESGDGRAALALANGRQLSLAVLDVNVPGMNGIELARRLGARKQAPVVVMLAAEADPWTVREALAAGARGFVTKTHAADFLRDALRAAWRGCQFLSPDSAEALARIEREEARPKPPGPSVLSEREREVLRLLAIGENTKSVAAHLKISPKTVETHRSHIMRKLRLDNIAALTRYAIHHKVLPE